MSVSIIGTPNLELESPFCSRCSLSLHLPSQFLGFPTCLRVEVSLIGNFLLIRICPDFTEHIGPWV